VATGAPIKIGVVSDGRTAAFDNTVQLRAAAAIVKYLNDYRGGIGGRPISLVTCETAGDPAGLRLRSAARPRPTSWPR